MEKLRITTIAAILLATTFIIAPAYPVKAETCLWGESIFSSGVPVTTPFDLEEGYLYRIEATEIFWYDAPNNLAADAMYYTTDPSDNWQWVNHFPAPLGHSFIQINGEDVDWGPFSNGDTYHTYSINYVGQGLPITFQIVDWIDGDYTNNYCHLPVEICIVRGGFTPGYWKNHQSSWPDPYETDDELQSVFGSNAPEVTLLEALNLRGGPRVEGAKQILARAATAALLNTAYFGSYYPIDYADLVGQVTAAFDSGNRVNIIQLATMLDNYNNLL